MSKESLHYQCLVSSLPSNAQAAKGSMDITWSLTSGAAVSYRHKIKTNLVKLSKLDTIVLV